MYDMLSSYVFGEFRIYLLFLLVYLRSSSCKISRNPYSSAFAPREPCTANKLRAGTVMGVCRTVCAYLRQLGPSLQLIRAV